MLRAVLAATILLSGVGGGNAAAVNGGERILFERGEAEGCGGEIWTAEADGTDARRLLLSGCSPRWSPDRRQLLYSREGAVGIAVYVADADGRNERRLTAGPEDYEADWSPDGRQVVFSRHLDNFTSWDLYVVASAGGAETRLTRSEDFDGTPDWSPDGARILFASYRAKGHLACGECAALFVRPGRARPVGRITRRSVQSLMPAWSPDGTRIAWARASSSDPEVVMSVWVMSADSRDARRLTVGEEPTWSPDGRTIMFTRGSSLWAIDAGGGDPRRVTTGRNASWASP